jgi:hypothetical protein
MVAALGGQSRQVSPGQVAVDRLIETAKPVGTLDVPTVEGDPPVNSDAKT